MITRGSYVLKPMVKFLLPLNNFFLISQSIDGFRQNNSQGFLLELIKL